MEIYFSQIVFSGALVEEAEVVGNLGVGRRELEEVCKCLDGFLIIFWVDDTKIELDLGSAFVIIPLVGIHGDGFGGVCICLGHQIIHQLDRSRFVNLVFDR